MSFAVRPAAASPRDQALRLEVASYTDADHWRWVLKSPQSAFLADHPVALDPRAAECAALHDLDGYLDRYAAPDHWLADHVRLLQEAGAWLGEQVLGPKKLIRRIAATHRLGIELRVLQYGVTREALGAVAEEGWDVLHFSGHGLPASLVLEQPDGTADPVPSTALVELLEPTRGRLSWSPCRPACRPRPVRPLRRWPARWCVSSTAPCWRCAAPWWTTSPSTSAPVCTSGCWARASPCHALQLGLRAALKGGPRPEAPPVMVATPALFGRQAADLALQPPRKPEGGFVIAETGFAHFPDEPERFVGRVAALSRARQALAPDSARAGMLFHGMAGAGKTTCALELAYGYEAGRFAGFVWHKAPEEGRDIAGALTAFALDIERQLPGFTMAHVVDRADALRAWLPLLTQLIEDHSILLVLDNLETLLTPDGQWRDARWGAVVDALLKHTGVSRTVLTSRIRPAGLDAGRVLIEPIHALSLAESVLLARELPHLSRLLRGSPQERELVVRTLREAQGHPKLLELADGQAADPQRLAAQLEQLEATAATDQAIGQVYLREGYSPLSDQAFLQKLEGWTRMVAGTLPQLRAPSSRCCARWRRTIG